LLGNPRAWTRRDAEGRVGSTGDLAQPEESGIQGEGTLEVGDADADVSEVHECRQRLVAEKTCSRREVGTSASKPGKPIKKWPVESFYGWALNPDLWPVPGRGRDA